MADGHEPRGSMWDLTGSAGCTMWPVLADTHQVSLATQMGSQMQLDSPHSIRPPNITVGAVSVAGVPDLNGFGVPPLPSQVDLCTTQSVKEVLHHATLQQLEVKLPSLQSVHAALRQAEALKQHAEMQAGLQAGRQAAVSAGIQQAVAVCSPEVGFENTHSGTMAYTMSQISAGVGGMGGVGGDSGGVGGVGGDSGGLGGVGELGPKALGYSQSDVQDANMEHDRSDESYEGKRNYGVYPQPTHLAPSTPLQTSPLPPNAQRPSLASSCRHTGGGYAHRQAGVDAGGGSGPYLSPNRNLTLI